MPTVTEVSWTQRLVLVLLLGASLAIFWRRLSAVLHIVRRSRPTSDFNLKPLGPRLRNFLWEVAAQGKVIQQRPLAGLAHAFVFWGFCAFGLITVNHLAAGFGLRLLLAASGFGRFYFTFVAF